MPKYTPTFNRLWNRLNKNYRSALKRGYTPDFTRPAKSEAFANKLFRNSLKTLSSPEYILKHSTYTTPQGKTVKATKIEKERRSAAVTRGNLTRKANRDFEKNYGYKPATRLKDETKLPVNIEWNEAAKAYMNTNTGEILPNIKDLPSEIEIGTGNIIDIVRNELPSEYFRNLLSRIREEYNSESFRKRRNPKWVRQSSQYTELLIHYIEHNIMRDEETMKRAMDNAFNAMSDDEIWAQINNLMYADSDSPELPSTSFITITRIFEGRDVGILSADEYPEEYY